MSLLREEGEVITTLALIGSVVGAWLVARHDIRGYFIWIFANILWVADSLGRGDIQQTILWLYYIFTCFIGIYSWRRVEGYVKGKE
jgi:nicotinamide riboside transporter PnuC